MQITIRLFLCLALASAVYPQVTPGPTFSTQWRSGQVFADYNADGRDDLIVENTVLVNTGNGVFLPPIALPVEGTIVDALDINGDRRPDFLTFDRPLGLPAGAAAPGSFRLFMAGDTGYRQAAVFPAGDWVFITDFDADGSDDVVLMRVDPATGATQKQSSILEFLRSRRDGTFDVTQTLSIPPMIPRDFEMRQRLASGDLNKDGKIDLAIRSLDDLVFLFGNGDGTFAAPVVRYLPREIGTVSTQIADIDSDTNLDIVLASSYPGSSIRVLFGDGQGHFPRVATTWFRPRADRGPNYPKSIVIGQFTGARPVEIAAGASNGDLLIFAWRDQSLSEVQRIQTEYPGLMLLGANLHGFGRTDLFAEATSSPVFIPWRFYLGTPVLAAQGRGQSSIGRRRASRSAGPSDLEFRVTFSGDCTDRMPASWRFKQEGMFWRGLDGSVEAAFDDGRLYVRLGDRGDFQSGWLARLSDDVYVGEVELQTQCAPSLRRATVTAVRQ